LFGIKDSLPPGYKNQIKTSLLWINDPPRVVVSDVVYEEGCGEIMRHIIVRALSQINSLESNELVLYAHLINGEETTLA
jgi:hypothetical protein